MSQRIAVLHPAYLGDVVFAGPLTRALAEAWPGCQITFVTRPPGDAIARHLPGVARVIVYDKHGADRGLDGLRATGARLRAVAAELVIALHASPRTAALAWLSGAPRRLGPWEGLGSVLYTQTEALDGLPFVARSQALVTALGLSAQPELELRLPVGLRFRGRASVPVKSVALVPGSEWATKRWPLANAARLAVLLKERGCAPVLLGSPAEQELCRELNARAGGVCVDLCGNTVEEALAVLSACVGMVGGDSGLTHAARALGIPTVTLFGPTPTDAHVPGPRDRFVSLGLSCSPCSPHGQRACPLGHHRCLADLDADRVLAALGALGAC